MLIPGVNGAFGLVYMNWPLYLVGIGMAFIPTVVIELSKLFGFVKSHK
jgi:hypothetical protein